MCPASLGQKSNSGFLSGVSHLLFKGSVCVWGGYVDMFMRVCAQYMYMQVHVNMVVHVMEARVFTGCLL